MAQEWDLAGEIGASADIDITILMPALILMGVLWSIKYLLVPLIKLLSPSGGSLIERAANWVISALLAPVRFVLQTVVSMVAEGIDAHAGRVTSFLNGMAWEIHDFTTAVGNMATETASTFHEMRTKTIPREINRRLVPIRRRLTTLETVRKQLDAIARRYGYADFPTLIRTATPHIKQLVAADLYVRSQGHVSLAGALSVYEASAKSWNKTQAEVRKLGYYTIPDFIRHTDTQIQKVIKPELQRQKLAIGKINKLLSLNKLGIPVLLAAMAPAAVAAFFRPAIPRVCTEVGECAATNLLGKGPWNFFKDLLKLLLAASLDALLLADLCLIAKGAQALAQAIEGPLRELVVVEGGLIGIGCASNPSVLPPPAY